VAGCEEIDVGGNDVEDHCCEEEKQDVDAFKVSARLCYPPGDLHYYYFVLFCFEFYVCTFERIYKKESIKSKGQKIH
jgi:hypothetical protein